LLDQVHRKFPNLALTAICCLVAIFLVGCEPEFPLENPENSETPNPQIIAQTPSPQTTQKTPTCENTGIENTQDRDIAYPIDLTKISPMIQENASEDVIAAAKTVIEAFLRYENSVEIQVSGNQHRFLNDMAYVIHCTCPLFSAFTDFNEMSSYDEISQKASWNFLAEKEDLDRIVQDFYELTGAYLSNVKSTDSEAMRAILLYYAIIDVWHNWDQE